MVHLFHLVNFSPWPFLVSFSLFSLILGVVFGNLILFILSFFAFSFCLFSWFKDISLDSLFGSHSVFVSHNLVIAFLLFILSEVCLFLSLFFCYFFSFWIPSVELASLFPPFGIHPLGSLPLVNTALLFFSGLSSTIALTYRIYLVPTLLFGFLFSSFQVLEYFSASFSFSDSIFGSNFYLLTGFHAFHVFFGLFFLIVKFGSFANLYWHFVDYVWILLFLFLY